LTKRNLHAHSLVSTARKHSRGPVLAALVLGGACLAAPTESFAQATAPAPPSNARELFKSGNKKYKAGDFSGALSDFQAVDALKPTPQAARFIGLCQDKLGHLADAVAAYERFLADVPPKLAPEAEEIKARVQAIKAMPGKVHVDTTPPGASVSIDGRPQPGPTPLDLELAPGKHTLHVSAPDREAQDRDIEVTYASTADVNVQLAAASSAPPPVPPPEAFNPPPPASAPPPPPPPEPRSKLPAYITGGLAIVSTGIGVVFGVLALNDKSSFNKDPTEATANSGENNALICDMALGVAVTLGVTSAVLFLTNDDAPPAPPKAAAVPKQKPRALTFSAAPIVTPHGGGAGAVLRF
jgi:PEGA domain